MMIPFMDYSFIKDEDDLALLDHLHSTNEEPVTGKQFYEHLFPELPLNLALTPWFILTT